MGIIRLIDKLPSKNAKGIGVKSQKDSKLVEEQKKVDS
jgi:hypothetical protein